LLLSFGVPCSRVDLAISGGYYTCKQEPTTTTSTSTSTLSVVVVVVVVVVVEWVIGLDGRLLTAV